MEIARAWGLAPYRRLRSIDTPPGWKSPIRFLDSAVGEEYGQIDSRGFFGPGPDISPAEPIMSSQERIEEIMLDQVRSSRLVDLRFSTRADRVVTGADDNDDSVSVEVTDLRSGTTETITGAALVAADGAYSTVRAQLGLQMEGARELSHLVNCYFRADIESHLNGRHGVLLFVNNANEDGPVNGVLQPLDTNGRWLCQINVSPEDWSPEAFDKDRAARWIRAAAGIPDLDVDVLSLGFWNLNATVAERLIVGRILLVGDAAHQFPPTGGLGVNTGLQGMHNAMWKLALWWRGEASWPLVETYETERRPVAQRITAQSLQNSINVGRIFAAAKAGAESGLDTATVLRESHRYGNHLGVEFGAQYYSTAVVSDGTTAPGVDDDYSEYTQSGSPGCRAPHVWLGTPGDPVSTHDLIGPAFTLIAAPQATAWRDAAVAVAEELDVRIDAYLVGSAGLQDEGRFADAYGIQADGAVLIRPDGHIAWRSTGGPADDAHLRSSLTQILAR